MRLEAVVDGDGKDDHGTGDENQPEGLVVVHLTLTGSRPDRVTTAATAGDDRNRISARAASRFFARVAMPAQNTVTRCAPAGNGPTMSIPAIGNSSLSCWNPISASPLATIVPTRSLSILRLFGAIASAIPSLGNSSVER